MPEWGNLLRNHYYQIRQCRAPNRTSQARRRRFYRYIKSEKKRLIESGVDAELVRLYCRSLSNLRNQNAAVRYENYARQQLLDFGL